MANILANRVCGKPVESKVLGRVFCGVELGSAFFTSGFSSGFCKQLFGFDRTTKIVF